MPKIITLDNLARFKSNLNDPIVFSKVVTDGQFSVTSDEFVKAANATVPCILQLRIGNYEYDLVKSVLDNNGIQFFSKDYVAYFDRNGANYSGRVEAYSGGTQLYMHTIGLEVIYYDEPDTATLVLINNSSDSLANKNWYTLVGYISGTISVAGGRKQQVVSIINEQDETHIIYYDTYGELQQLYPDWSGEHHGYTVSDTVTPL